MAKLKPSEFRLLLLFAIVAFVLANVYGYQMLASRHGEILKQRDLLEGRIKTAAVYEMAEGESLKMDAWLNQRVPVYGSEDQMKTFLLKFVEQRASSFSLVPELQPREPELRDGYMRSILEVKLSGTIDQILGLVFSLQDPEEFRAINSFDLKSKPKEPKTLFAEFTIEQWWNPDSPALVESGAAAPAADPPPPVVPVPAPGVPGAAPAVPPPAPGDGGGVQPPSGDAPQVPTDDATLDDATPDDAAPDDAAPDDVTLDDATPDDATLDDAEPAVGGAGGRRVLLPPNRTPDIAEEVAPSAEAETDFETEPGAESEVPDQDPVAEEDPQ